MGDFVKIVKRAGSIKRDPTEKNLKNSWAQSSLNRIPRVPPWVDIFNHFQHILATHLIYVGFGIPYGLQSCLNIWRTGPCHVLGFGLLFQSCKLGVCKNNCLNRQNVWRIINLLKKYLTNNSKVTAYLLSLPWSHMPGELGLESLVVFKFNLNALPDGVWDMT